MSDPFDLDAELEEASKKYGLNPDLARAVASTESQGDPRALSNKGAMGVMQLMPDTAKELGVKDPWDPKQNIDAGVRYLSQLYRDYNGDLDKTFAAYNAGPGAVARWKGVPPYHETRDYVATNRRKLQAFADQRSGKGQVMDAEEFSKLVGP